MIDLLVEAVRSEGVAAIVTTHDPLPWRRTPIALSCCETDVSTEPSTGDIVPPNSARMAG